MPNKKPLYGIQTISVSLWILKITHKHWLKYIKIGYSVSNKYYNYKIQFTVIITGIH